MRGKFMKTYTKEELLKIEEIAQNEAYIKKEEAVLIALNYAKIREPYPKYEVDFDYETSEENNLEARYTVSFTIDATNYSYVIQATTGKILSRSFL